MIFSALNPADRAAAKRELRVKMRALSAEENRTSVAENTASILGNISHWLVAHPEARHIASYAALSGEPDLLPLLGTHPHLTWLLPRIAGAGLTFHAISGVDQLLPGRFGIREPRPGLPEFPIGEIDAFFCPGLAFDPHGGRLGRGRGFYDRLLANARPGAWKIGICSPEKLIPDTFSESHDIPMDFVISGNS